MPIGAFNICCPRDAFSRTANVERTGRHKWVKTNIRPYPELSAWCVPREYLSNCIIWRSKNSISNFTFSESHFLYQTFFFSFYKTLFYTKLFIIYSSCNLTLVQTTFHTIFNNFISFLSNNLTFFLTDAYVFPQLALLCVAREMGCFSPPGFSPLKSFPRRFFHRLT